MPGEVAVITYGFDMLAQELVAVGERAGNLTEFWVGIEAKLEAIEREQFASSGSRGPSGPWPDNTEEWNWEKFRTGQSLEKLRATEVMMEALTGEGFAMAAIRTKTPSELHFGADLKQFAIWQSGYRTGGENRPRYPIDLTPEDEREIAADILGHILGPMGSGLTVDKQGRRRIAKGFPGAGRFA